MKEKNKQLKTLLKSGFQPLEISKEGKLQGGFSAIDPNKNCRGNCDCPPANSVCPKKQNEEEKQQRDTIIDPNANCRGNCDCPPANGVCPKNKDNEKGSFKI